MSNISMPSGITKGKAMPCCSLGVRISAATGRFNAASDWADSCVITIKRQRKRGEAPQMNFLTLRGSLFAETIKFRFRIQEWPVGTGPFPISLK
jgi:hypothetical protein